MCGTSSHCNACLVTNTLSKDNKYMNFKNLAIAFKQNPDLAWMCSERLVEYADTIQCDYVKLIFFKDFLWCFSACLFHKWLTLFIKCVSNKQPCGILSLHEAVCSCLLKKATARYQVAIPTQLFNGDTEADRHKLMV